MYDRSLPASPNWYCSRCCDVSSCSGLLGVGAKNTIYLIDISASSCSVVGELAGHKDVVSSFSFCQLAAQSHLCVSSSNDGTVRFWNANDKVLIREHTGHRSSVTAVHWSPADHNLVVSGDEKGIVFCHWHHTGDTVSFFPEPRTIFCLSCSPHTWSTVAVGYKDGMIALIDVAKRGEVMQRLRGHEDEIHSLAWSPLDREGSLSSRSEDGEVAMPVPGGDQTGCYLASGSRDQTLRIWSSARGKAVMTLKLPYLKKRGSAVDPGVKERLWLHVHWPKGRPTQIVSSCFSGEIVMWDLTRSGKSKWSLFGTSSDSQSHSRIVFNMSSMMLQDGRELLISTSMDREIKCWNLASLDCCWTLPTLGGFVYAMGFSPVGTGCLALGVGDNMVRVWNTLSTQNQYDTRSFWQGIKSKVTALAWHPKREGSLAFGTDDGKVGIYDVFSNKPPQISSSYHRKTVYTLAWGPPVPPVSLGVAEGKRAHSLYSCAGEGVVLQHDPARLSNEASDIDQLIRDTNCIKHKLSPHTDISWKPDGRVVAIGNEDGCIDIYQAPSLKLLCSIQQHHKIINTLRWHRGTAPELHGLLASGSSNAIVFVHDLRAVIENPPESLLVMTEPHRRLCGHTGKITGMAWSPHHDGRLVTVSYDSTAQVWDVLQEAPLANYRGHVGYLLSVDWSPVDPDVIWTGGKDSTVQEWRVSKQEFTKPPKGKKMVDLKEKMKTNLKQKKKNKKTPGAGGAASAAVELEAEAATNGHKATAEGLSGDDEEEETSTANGTAAAATTTPEIQRKTFAVPKSKEKPDLLKKKKLRSMLPLSNSMDHRPKEDLLQDCIKLASITHGNAPPAGCVAGQREYMYLGLFSDRAALRQMFQAEEEAHLEAGHFDSVMYLRLWSGDLEGALQLATERGELNDHLLSIAPMAGFGVWSRTVEAFVRQLCLQEQYLKAATHLLSINRVHEAIELLHSHKFYREAIALAKARLPANDPVLKELYSNWAALLEKDGHFSAAAKCYLSAGASFDAAKVIARKNDVPSLRTAATLANISGEAALAQSLALRCAKDLAASLDWQGAQEVLSSQEQLLVHQLHLCTAELLATLLDPPGAPSASGHAWASPSPSNGNIRARLRAVWEEHFGVSQTSTGRRSAEVLLQELKSAEAPPPTASVPLRQVLLYISLHVTAATLSWMSGDGGREMKELWKAAAWLRDGEHFCLSAQLCSLMFPDGVVWPQHQFGPEEEGESEAAARSLQALVNYHRLYQHWWRNSAHLPTSHARPAAEKTEVNGGGGASQSEILDFDACVLLSELHAAHQEIQREVTDVQERLAAIMLQHNQASAGQAQDDGTLAGERSENQDSLLSLSTRMTRHQQELADVPEKIKAFPHPDVVECCLVLLHLDATSPHCVPPTVLQEALLLLRKHATTPALLKASQRFLT